MLMTKSALVIWEYLISLAKEVDIFWKRPKTATSLLFIGTRWIMVTNMLLEFASITVDSMFAFMPLPCMSHINIFLSNCEALNWAVEVIFLVEYLGTECKQVTSPIYIFYVALMVHSIFRHTRICHLETKLSMGLRSFTSGSCSCSDELGKHTHHGFDYPLG